MISCSNSSSPLQACGLKTANEDLMDLFCTRFVFLNNLYNFYSKLIGSNYVKCATMENDINTVYNNFKNLEIGLYFNVLYYMLKVI